MPQNPTKQAFKDLIVEQVLASKKPVPRAVLLAYARAERPDLFDDATPCYSGCDSHDALWKHLWQRSLYDLTKTKPPRIWSSGDGFYSKP